MSPVVVDNTHTQRWEARAYVATALQHGYAVRVAEPDTAWRRNAAELAARNTHGVPEVAIRRMLARWEDDFSVDSIMRDAPPPRPQPQSEQASRVAPKTQASTTMATMMASARLFKGVHAAPTAQLLQHLESRGEKLALRLWMLDCWSVSCVCSTGRSF